jgi:hypothetical protein
MREPQPLPLEARRAAWDRLWRILLATPIAEPVRRGTDTTEHIGADAPMEDR